MKTIKIEQIDESLIREIRLYSNKIEKQNLLIINMEVWHRLCVSLDTIEDSMWAIQYYVGNDYPEDFKGKYLFTYGLLQAVFLQQDALKHMCLSLFGKEIDYKIEYPKLYRIREIRNDIVGHPTNKKRDGKKYFISMWQHSMTKHEFKYMVCSDDIEYKTVDVSELINLQNQYINNILQKIVERQNKEFEEYIYMHKDKKLVDYFDGLQYKKEKILIHAYDYDDIKKPYLESIKQMVENCKEELNKRYVSWEKVESYKYIINEITELFDILLNKLPCLLYEDNQVIEKYLVQHLFCKLDKLVEYCIETDKYFEDSPNK